MSDEDLLSPAEREMEAALRSLRPSAARLELAPSVALASHDWGDVRPTRPWVRRAAIAAAVVAAATCALLWLSPHQKSEDRVAQQAPRHATENTDADAVLIQASVDPPTLLAYRQALGRSSAELEALFDRQETSGAASSRQFTPAAALTLWIADPHSPLGEL